MAYQPGDIIAVVVDRDPQERIDELLRSNNELRERAMRAETHAQNAIILAQTFSTLVADLAAGKKKADGQLLMLRVRLRERLQMLEANPDGWSRDVGEVQHLRDLLTRGPS
jgi:hypothetical protein